MRLEVITKMEILIGILIAVAVFAGLAYGAVRLWKYVVKP